MMTMKRILTVLMLACIVFVPSCKSGESKKKGSSKKEATLAELVEKATESQRVGIWYVANYHSPNTTPTLSSDRVKDPTSKAICSISSSIGSMDALFLTFISGRDFPIVSKDEMFTTELHLKSDNQDELVLYGSARTWDTGAKFDSKDSMEIFKYFARAESNVNVSFIGYSYQDAFYEMKLVPQTMSYEFPIEGYREVCKCWINILKERGKTRGLE